MWEIFTYGQQPYDDWDNQTVLACVDRGERLSKPRVRLCLPPFCLSVFLLSVFLCLSSEFHFEGEHLVPLV